MRIKSPFSSLSILLLLSFSAGLLIPSSVLAQTSEKEKAQRELERRQELERKTLGLLDEIVVGSWSLKLPENRALVMTTAADLLWTRDEKRARNLFWEALNSIASPASQAGDDSKTKSPNTKDSTPKGPANDNPQRLKEYYSAFGAREEFLGRVARRDPQLALDMLRATRLPPPPQQPANANYRLPDESDLEQEIANEVAWRDPKRALQIAREGLTKGLNFRLLNVLFRLNQQSPETASEFASDLIDKLQTANLNTDVVACMMSVQLLRIARSPQDDQVESAAVLGSGRLKLSDDQKRELVETLTNAVLSVSASGRLLLEVSEVMPEIEQFAPDRAAKIKTRVAETKRTLIREQGDWNLYSSLVEKGTPEELIKAAARTGNDTRQEIYQAAVMKAVIKGKADALREFIKSNVDDDSQRNSLNDLLDEQQIGWAVDQGKIEELQALLPLIRLKEKRVEAMAEVAMLLEKKGEHAEAIELLDDAQALVKVDFASKTRSDALMAVMLACSLIDPSRAFALIEPIIDRANDNISKLLLLDKMIKTGAVKNGEIIVRHPGVISLDFAIFKYGQGVAALANADFNRTRAMADRFQRNELRLMARLMIAQALLRVSEPVAKKNSE